MAAEPITTPGSARAVTAHAHPDGELIAAAKHHKEAREPRVLKQDASKPGAIYPDAAKQQESDAGDLASDCLARVGDIPARTLAGLQAKVQTLWLDEDYVPGKKPDDLLSSLLRDINAMAAADDDLIGLCAQFDALELQDQALFATCPPQPDAEAAVDQQHELIADLQASILAQLTTRRATTEEGHRARARSLHLRAAGRLEHDGQDGGYFDGQLSWLLVRDILDLPPLPEHDDLDLQPDIEITPAGHQALAGARS